MRLLALCFSIFLFSACAKKPVYPDAPVSGGEITIDVRALKEKSPVFYSVQDGDKRIDFFVVKVNGGVESYFDACAKCYPDKLGYRTDNQHVICKKCDVRYSIEDLKTGVGSCYPIALKGRMEGDRYLIDKKDVVEGERYF